MNTHYWDKATLYFHVDKLKKSMGFTEVIESPDPFEIVQRYVKNPEIEYVPFPTTKICGILYKGDRSTSIALNANRTKEMQNFDCMHELIHYFLHDMSYCQCICSDSTNVAQDSYLEWQANEGTAQFLVPYQDFIPRFSKQLASNYGNIPYILAEHYRVTPHVINIRLDSLAYEIDQYRIGTPLNDLKLLSRTKRNAQGIRPTCYNAICDFPLDWDSAIGI